MKRLLICLLLFCTNCFAEPIEFVVSSLAGGPDDTVTRKVVDLLEANTNLRFVVMYIPGAAHRIGYNYIMRSEKPTVTISTTEILENDVIGYVETIYTLGEFNNAIAVNAKSKFFTIQDLSNKAIVNFGHGGEGTFSQKAMQQLCASMNCLPVPFKGGSEGMLNILNNTIDAFAIANYGTLYSNNDKFRIVGYTRVKNSWLKIFGKNLSKQDTKTIRDILKNTNTKFYTDMGLTQ